MRPIAAGSVKTKGNNSDVLNRNSCTKCYCVRILDPVKLVFHNVYSLNAALVAQKTSTSSDRFVVTEMKLLDPLPPDIQEKRRRFDVS